MSEAYNRLLTLYSDIGLCTDEGSFSEAEAYALSSGISLVESVFNEGIKSIFCGMNAEYDKTDGYANMLGLDSSRADGETIYNAVRARLSDSYGDAAVSAAYNREKQIMGDISVTRQQNGYIISGVTADTVFFLGKFIEGAVPFDLGVYLTGGGLTFAELDALNQTFGFFNKLHIPFGCIDTMPGELF